MIFDDRFCEYCERRLAKRKRADARFCSHRCKLAAQRYRMRQEHPQTATLSRDASHRAHHPSSIARSAVSLQLEETLLQHAPAGAVGYRLGEGFQIEGRHREIWFYPSSDRPSLRSNGRRVLRSYFLLHPFELPVVPQAGLYGVEYMDAVGKKFPVPTALLAGVQVECDSYPIRIQDGDRWSPG